MLVRNPHPPPDLPRELVPVHLRLCELTEDDWQRLLTSIERDLDVVAPIVVVRQGAYRRGIVPVGN